MKNYPTEEQVRTLREGLRGHHLEAMMVLALVTGIRRDELRRLNWPQVNLETGEMHVLDSKTKSHARLIHLPQDILPVLKQHALRQAEQCKEADTARRHLHLVFPDRTAGVMSAQRLLAEWDAVLEQVGLPRLRFHDLRVLVWRGLLEQLCASPEGRDGTQERSPDLDKKIDEHSSS